MQSSRRESELVKRVATLEKEFNELANLMANHVANVPRILIGWAEISAYMRIPARTLSRYAKTMAFPAYRLGRHVFTSPHIVDAWLRAIHAQRKQRKALMEKAKRNFRKDVGKL